MRVKGKKERKNYNRRAKAEKTELSHVGVSIRTWTWTSNIGGAKFFKDKKSSIETKLRSEYHIWSLLPIQREG